MTLSLCLALALLAAPQGDGELELRIEGPLEVLHLDGVRVRTRVLLDLAPSESVTLRVPWLPVDDSVAPQLRVAEGEAPPYLDLSQSSRRLMWPRWRSAAPSSLSQVLDAESTATRALTPAHGSTPTRAVAPLYAGLGTRRCHSAEASSSPLQLRARARHEEAAAARVAVVGDSSVRP